MLLPIPDIENPHTNLKNVDSATRNQSIEKIARILLSYSTKFCNKLGHFQYVNNFATYSEHSSLLRTRKNARKIQVKSVS